MNSHDYEEVKTMTNVKAVETIEIFDYDLEADVTEFLASVEDSEYITDWCKEILPDSDEY